MSRKNNKVVVTITEEQIAAGKRNSLTKNPVAQAIKSATGKSAVATVDGGSLNFRSTSPTFFALPVKVTKALSKYNSTGTLAPQSFSISL